MPFLSNSNSMPSSSAILKYDLGKDGKFSVHHVLAKSGILIVENLANLDKINSEEFHLIVAPLKLKNATGSPVRAMALVD